MGEADGPKLRPLTEAQAARAEAVFVEHRRYIESVAKRYAARADDVPDITQSVGMRICRKLDGFRGESHLRTWLFRVTVNVCNDHYRSQRRYDRGVEALTVAVDVEPTIDPDEHVHYNHALERVRSAVSEMDAPYRNALRDLVRTRAGLAPISTEGSMREGAKRSRLFRARQQLRNILDV